MNIQSQIELTLRAAGFQTWTWRHSGSETICFEDKTTIGFAHVFESCNDLLSGWQQSQQRTLAAHGLALRSAASKAWNVYSIFFAPDDPSDKSSQMEALEEDFTFTRKIARGLIQTTADVELALLPLLPIRNIPSSKPADYLQRVRSNLASLPAVAAAAFLTDAEPEDVVSILSETT